MENYIRVEIASSLLEMVKMTARNHKESIPTENKKELEPIIVEISTSNNKKKDYYLLSPNGVDCQ